jgi:hypothetical protein
MIGQVSPQRFSTRQSESRSWSWSSLVRDRTFPYAIVYGDNGDHIRILALAGNRQRPYSWVDRA